MNGNLYIGSTYTNFARRWGEHMRFLVRGNHHSKKLQSAWNFFEASSFTFSILEQCEKDMCEEREQFWMDILRPEYNMAPIAWSPSRPKGYKHTAETVLKMKLSATGRRHSKGAIEKIRAARYLQGSPFEGRSHTPESKLKISRSKTGVKWDGSNGDHYMIGRTATLETRNKMKESAKLGWIKRRASK